MEAAHRALADRGPLSAADLRDRLRSDGFSPTIERLAQLPDRFPGRFQLSDDGLLTIASNEDGAPADKPADERADWYRPTSLPRVPADRVAVLDIETTGLDRHTDSTWEIALVRLDGHVLMHAPVQLPAGVALPVAESSEPRVSLQTALDQLNQQLAGIELVVGHNLLGFDKPFLETEARRAGIDPPRFSLCADTLHLSLLIDVAIPKPIAQRSPTPVRRRPRRAAPSTA